MKKLSVVLATVAMAMSLVACGGGEEKVTEIDAAALAERLVSEVTYTEELKEDDAENYFMLAEGVEGILYTPAGFSGEEVAVFTAPDEETAQSTKEMVEGFLAEQSATMAPYAPDAVERIDDAVLVQNGNYVILCVSEDSEKAEEIIKEVFGE